MAIAKKIITRVVGGITGKGKTSVNPVYRNSENFNFWETDSEKFYRKNPDAVKPAQKKELTKREAGEQRRAEDLRKAEEAKKRRLAREEYANRPEVKEAIKKKEREDLIRAERQWRDEADRYYRNNPGRA